MLLTPKWAGRTDKVLFWSQVAVASSACPVGMLHRQQEGQWEASAVSVPGVQRGIEGQRWWKGRGQMGEQPTEGVPSPRLQPPPPALSSVLALRVQGLWADSRSLDS